MKYEYRWITGVGRQYFFNWDKRLYLTHTLAEEAFTGFLIEGIDATKKLILLSETHGIVTVARLKIPRMPDDQDSQIIMIDLTGGCRQAGCTRSSLMAESKIQDEKVYLHTRTEQRETTCFSSIP